MNIKQYKMYRSNGFPISKKKSQQIIPNYSTYALLPKDQPKGYQVHKDDQDLILFNEHQYTERKFTNIFLQQKEAYQKVKLTLQNNQNNLIIFPVLETDQAQRLIFDRRQQKEQQVQNKQKQYQKESILKQMVESIFNGKQSHTIITLSIFGVKPNGNLIDQLNFQWLQEQQYKSYSVSQLSKNLNNKQQIKITKTNKNDIKIFQLNRQQISCWKQAKQIYQHYFQIHDYLNAWTSEKNTRLYGQIFQISQVQVDPNDGSILQTKKKTSFLKFNQYLKGQALSDNVRNKQPISKRDNPLMLLLSQCFMKNSNYHFQIFSQIGHSQTIKQQNVNLAFNLQLPDKYLYLKVQI